MNYSSQPGTIHYNVVYSLELRQCRKYTLTLTATDMDVDAHNLVFRRDLFLVDDTAAGLVDDFFHGRQLLIAFVYKAFRYG
ncbi:MAG: hypothetical protein HW407_1561 [Bacteroidetes bacterium]|nr:hypothetical protein [Bacteroidota bacterium]